jgi:hypothetical protein
MKSKNFRIVSALQLDHIANCAKKVITEILQVVVLHVCVHQKNKILQKIVPLLEEPANSSSVRVKQAIRGQNVMNVAKDTGVISSKREARANRASVIRTGVKVYSVTKERDIVSVNQASQE